jgi:hypothetical protein
MGVEERIEQEVQAVITLIREAAGHLGKPMPDVGPLLIKHLMHIDAYRFTFLAKAAILNGYSRAHKGEKIGGRARVGAELAEGAADAIRYRVSLGQSILNYLMSEMKSGMSG